jgi:hypothetical protein
VPVFLTNTLYGTSYTVVLIDLAAVFNDFTTSMTWMSDGTGGAQPATGVFKPVHVGATGGVEPPVGSMLAKLVMVLPAADGKVLSLMLSTDVPLMAVIAAAPAPAKVQVTVTGPATAGLPEGKHVQLVPLNPVYWVSAGMASDTVAVLAF